MPGRDPEEAYLADMLVELTEMLERGDMRHGIWHRDFS